MALSFADAPGNLFNRIGRLGKLLYQARLYQSAQDSNFTGTNQAIQQLSSEPDIQSTLGSAYIGNLNATGDNTGNLCQQVGIQVVNRMVFRDSPQPNQSLTQINLIGSVQNVILQMQQQGASVLQFTVTATPGTFQGTGNGVIVASLYRPQDGLIQQLAFAENIQVLCVQDSYTGGAAAGNEGFLVQGEGAETDPFAFDWPLGSGASIGMLAIDGNSSNSAGNFLTNSGFTDWTSNVPDNWTLEVGTAGTSIYQENTIVYDDSGSSLAIVGDGATLTTLSQTFDSSSGTAAQLDDVTQYMENLFIRRDGVAAAAGTLVVEIVDADTNIAIQDEGGTAASFSIDLTALSTAWVSYTGNFRTPAVLPDSVKVRLRLSTALTNGRTVYLDKMALGQGQRLYPSGPYLAIFSGSTNFVQADYANVTIANSLGAGGTTSTFQILCSLLWGDAANELLLPYSGAPTVNDSLITS